MNTYGVAVTPSDTDNIDAANTTPFNTLTCTTAGPASIYTESGNTVIVSLVLGIPWNGCNFLRVNSTGTTAAGLVAFR